jgi:hypothetical protein
VAVSRNKLKKSGNFQKALRFWELGTIDGRAVMFVFYFILLVTCYYKDFVLKMFELY